MIRSGARGHGMELHSEKEDRRPDNIWIGGMDQCGHGLRKWTVGKFVEAVGFGLSKLEARK